MAFPIEDKLGGMDAVLDVIEKVRGKRPSSHSVRAWKLARKIPAINAMVLMAECQKRGIPFDLSDCSRSDTRTPVRSGTRQGVSPA